MSSNSTCNPKAWREALKEKNWSCNPRDEAEAYEVQKRVTEEAKEVWGSIMGWKIALSSEESKRTFGGGPIYGPLFEKGFLGNGSRVEIRKLTDPLLEVELLYCQGSYFFAFEIPDNRYGRPWSEINWLQLIADLAGSNKVVVGKEVKKFDEEVTLRGPDIELSITIDLEKLERNKRFLEEKGLSGCLLLGTIVKPIKPREGTYVLECCGSETSVTLL